MDLYAGFDLGGTDLKFGLIDQDYNIVHHDKTPSPEKAADLIRAIQD